MAKKAVPIIAPALAQQAVRCIKKAAAGIEALSESELALGMTLHTISVETDLSRVEVAKVLQELAKLPKHCLAVEDPVEEKKAPRRLIRQAKRRRDKQAVKA